MTTPPPPETARALLRELRSAGVDAELAKVTGTWNVNEMALAVARRQEAGHVLPPVSKQFRSLRGGGALRATTVTKLCKRFPASRIAVWDVHPFGQLLCDPRMSWESLRALILGMKHGAERTCIALDGMSMAGVESTFIPPWTSDRTDYLEELATPMALYALICRERLHLIENPHWHGWKAARAIWRVLPSACRDCTHLLLGSEALFKGVDYFLSWEPHSSLRLFGAACDSACLASARQEARAKLDAVQTQAVDEGRIPAEVFMARKVRAASISVP